MTPGEHDSDKSLKLRNKQIDSVRKILSRNGYSAQLLRDAMEDVTSHIMGTPEKGLFFAVATALVMVQAKHGIKIYEAEEAAASEKDSMQHTIKNKMSRENQGNAIRRFFLGD